MRYYCLIFTQPSPVSAFQPCFRELPLFLDKKNKKIKGHLCDCNAKTEETAELVVFTSSNFLSVDRTLTPMNTRCLSQQGEDLLIRAHAVTRHSRSTMRASPPTRLSTSTSPKSKANACATSPKEMLRTPNAMIAQWDRRRLQDARDPRSILTPRKAFFS